MTENSSIPFLDLVTPHVELEEELLDVLKTAIHTAGFIGGQVLLNFEAGFARYCDWNSASA